MLQTTHALASGLIASTIPSPYISFPLILASHYLLDSIPHWDTGTGLREGKKNVRRAVIETIVDLGVAGLLVFLTFQIGRTFMPKLWLGVLIGISPDLLEAPSLFLNIHVFILNQLEAFHLSLHHRDEFPWGLIPQLVVINLVLLVSLLFL